MEELTIIRLKIQEHTERVQNIRRFGGGQNLMKLCTLKSSKQGLIQKFFLPGTQY